MKERVKPMKKFNSSFIFNKIKIKLSFNCSFIFNKPILSFIFLIK